MPKEFRKLVTLKMHLQSISSTSLSPTLYELRVIENKNDYNDGSKKNRPVTLNTDVYKRQYLHYILTVHSVRTRTFYQHTDEPCKPPTFITHVNVTNIFCEIITSCDCQGQ